MKEEKTVGILEENYNRFSADLSWLKSFDFQNVVVFILLVLLILAIIYPEKIKTIKVFLLSAFAAIGCLRKSFLNNKYEAALEDAAKKINSELGVDYLPTDCKIKWVKDISRESFIKEGKVVVKLSYKEDNNKNMTNAIVGYLHKGLFNNARTYISPDIAKSSELMVARKFILKNNNDECLRYFTEDILEPILDKDGQLRNCIEDLGILDSKGLFLQIFLPEILAFGYNLYPDRTPCKGMYDETKLLLEFLCKVANRRLGEAIELGYVSHYFNFRIMIIGKSAKLDVSTDPYINAIKGIIRDGYKKIYILSEGNKQTGAREIISEVAKLPKVSEIKPRRTEIFWLDGRKEEGMCYVVSLNKEKNNIAV